MRALVETGVLGGERGAYRLDTALPSMQLPATVQAVVAARMDRLPSEEKHLLQTAAVIGNEVPLPLLQTIAEIPEERLHHSIAHLQAAEFLYETHLFPEQEYTFKHALTHQVAYGSLLQERRRVLHSRIVGALEGVRPRAGGRAGRTTGAPCPAGRGMGQGRDLLPAGRRQGFRPRRVPRGGGFLRAGPPGPRAPTRGQRHPGAGPRALPRVGGRAAPTGRVRAVPGPVGRGRDPGSGTRRSRPAGMGAGQDGPGTQADGRPRWRHGGGPAGPRAGGCARRQCPAGICIPYPGADLLCQRRLRPGGRATAAERGGGRPGVWHAHHTPAVQFPGVAGADLECAWGLCRGPAPR